MQGSSVVRPSTTTRAGATALITLFLLAIHIPAVTLGANRFGFVLPSAILVLGLLVARSSRIAPPKHASWLWLSVICWGGVQIGLGLTSDSGEAARILARFSLYAAVFLIAADIARQPFQGGFLVKATAAWITLICLYGLIAWAAGVNPVLAEAEAYPTSLEATFISRNAFALYAVFGLLASLSVLVRTADDIFTRRGWIWAAAAAICAAALLLTGSRGGLGAGFIGVLIFAVTYGTRRSLTLTLSIGLVAMGVAGEAFLRKAPLFEDPRFTIHGQLLKETAKAPLTGHGLGAFQDLFRASLGGEWRWGDWDHAHQQYLETAYELGWPAALAMFAAIVLAAPRPLRGDPISALSLAALGAAAAHALVDFSLTIPSVAMTLALFLGVASGRQRRAA